MLRHIFFYTMFAITMFPFYGALVIPAWIFKLLGKRDLRKGYVEKISSVYFRFMIRLTGSRVSVRGQENLPDPSTSNICLVSNHQSYFDILLIEAYIPFLVGFVAKKELGKIPFFRTWMKELGCVLIDRRSARSAIEAISSGVDSIRSGHPLVLFPEGTRSKGQRMNAIKPGSLKLAIRSEAVIVPITLNYSYKIYEESSRVKAAEVSLVIHEPINTALEKISSRSLAEKLQRIIESALLEG